jgi:hypothetical protein
VRVAAFSFRLDSTASRRSVGSGNPEATVAAHPAAHSVREDSQARFPGDRVAREALPVKVSADRAAEAAPTDAVAGRQVVAPAVHSVGEAFSRTG